MARKRIPRTVPPFARLYPRFRGFPPQAHLGAELARCLRETIARVRTVEPQPFYSIRDTAAFFRVSFKTAADAYARLEREGLLTRIRGAQTLLHGSRARSTHAIRGVVGVPVYLPPLVVGTDWRAFLVRLEDELRRRHYVTDFILYSRREQSRDELVERMLEHDLDLVLWYAPIQVHAPTMLRLRDAGIRLVVLSDGKGVFPSEQYHLDLVQAIDEGVAAWQAEGVTSYVILQSPEYPSQHAFDIAQNVLARRQIDAEVRQVADDAMEDTVRALTRRRAAGVILLSHMWYERLCGRYPVAMEDLFRRTRVFLTQGPVYAPYLTGKTVYADSIELPNDDMARRIAADIGTGRAFRGDRLATFRTRFLPCVNLGTVSRSL